MAIAINKEDYIFVAHFEFYNFSKEGMIYMMNSKGNIIQTIFLPDYPQINGMTFSKNNDNILLLTDYSNTPVCLRVLIRNHDEKNQDKNEDFDKFN